MPIDWREHIVSTADILRGKPRIKGTRIPVSLILGCLKVAAEAQFSCPQFGPHALRPISYLGTLLAFEVHVTPDSSILAIMI